MSTDKRFWLKVGGLIIFFLTLWGSPNLGLQQGSPLGVARCLAEEFFGQQVSIGNQISEEGVSSATAIDRSFQGSRGIMSVNQAVGSACNQSTVVKVDMTSGISLPNKLSVGMYLGDNSLTTGNSNYAVTISGESFRGSSGIATVNQAAGNLNNQFTAVGVYVGRFQPTSVQPTIMFNVNGTSSIVGLSSAQLSAVVASSGNTVSMTGNQKASATVPDGAFKDFTGIAAVSQVAGNMNQVVNHIGVNVNR